MLPLDIYRRQARNLAWYDDEDGEPSRNPFKKFRRRPQRRHSIQLEAQTRSMGDLSLPEEQRRQQDFHDDGLAVRNHSNTFPPATASSDHFTAASAERNEPSIASQKPINVSSEQGSDLDPEEGTGKTRQRKGLFARGSTENDTLKDDSSEDRPKPPKFTLASQLRATIFNSWINVLFFAAPAGIGLYAANANPVAIFVVNFIAIIPLAAMLSFATEEIALRTGETIGGLLNATFGNAVELIVAIIALVKKEVVIVQTSLIGSMLSNLLLVMGMCFFFGGINRMEQHFNVTVAQTAASILAIAVAALIIPTAFSWSDSTTDHADKVAPLSRGTSILLLIVYGCYLFFQLKSHVEIYNRPSPKVEKRRQKITEGDTTRNIAQIGRMTAGTMGGEQVQQVQLHEEDEPEQPQLMIWVAVLTLVVSTAFVGVCAEFMVDSISALTATGAIGETFVGLVLLPIVGNAAEHATAVTVACKDKMDLAIGVAVGSSMQIALLVLPLIVVIGWIMGVDDMTLAFDNFQVILLFVAVLLVNYLIADGKSHWLEGVLLMTMYLLIALAAWFY
ncbi:vacuolar calcium ion transporter [Penicillium verhagenii]|uniref:vacuolar calcium ion transporter n=1 Tax=Penicillium verhagenii TaxID=1562060 RepID=UPI00254500C1|nr:vacuolar calcium ion transporter [Penicillium verhagenii]KAJ5934432.1 vacuolar calcium ion transporter [Penicillium verhagenii]